MKARIIALAIALAFLAALWLSGAAVAGTTGTVKPVVHVVSAYSGGLSLGGDIDQDGVMDFGFLVPGGGVATRGLTLNVNANAPWRLTVTSTQNLAVGGFELTKYIAADKFTFTSSGCTGPTYRSADTAFRSSGSDQGQEVTVDVVTAGPANGSCQVNVLYRLEVPTAQTEGYYSAGNHVYTLIVGQ